MSAVIPSPRFAVALAVELSKLRRSLALLLASVAPALVAVFVFFHLLRAETPAEWSLLLRSAAGIWSFFMLPMSVTALTALIAHVEHGPRSWEHLRALPLPAWHLYLSKLVCSLGLVLYMSGVLALLTPLAVELASWLKPAVAPLDRADIGDFLTILARMFVAGWLLVAVQLWIALRFASFVPALAVGIAGTFFAVVAASARIGIVLPWQIPVNQLASDPARADLALAIGGLGGILLSALMLWRMSRREVI